MPARAAENQRETAQNWPRKADQNHVYAVVVAGGVGVLRLVLVFGKRRKIGVDQVLDLKARPAIGVVGCG